jgi:hypothetical protein
MVASSSTNISSWWTKITRGRQSEGKKKEVAMAMYVVWNIWKERGRRIFQQKTITAHALAGLILADISLLELAKGRVQFMDV